MTKLDLLKYYLSNRMIVKKDGVLYLKTRWYSPIFIGLVILYVNLILVMAVVVLSQGIVAAFKNMWHEVFIDECNDGFTKMVRGQTELTRYTGKVRDCVFAKSIQAVAKDKFGYKGDNK